MVDLRVVDEDVSSSSSSSSAAAAVVVAIRVFSDDVVIDVVDTEPKNGNCRHQSVPTTDEFVVVVVVDGLELLTDDG